MVALQIDGDHRQRRHANVLDWQTDKLFLVRVVLGGVAIIAIMAFMAYFDTVCCEWGINFTERGR